MRTWNSYFSFVKHSSSDLVGMGREARVPIALNDIIMTNRILRLGSL